MSYAIELTPEAEKDIKKFKKSGDIKTLKKIDRLLNELREHPTFGTGKPEQLKHYKTPTWSRRISGKHRLICRIQENKLLYWFFLFGVITKTTDWRSFRIR